MDIKGKLTGLLTLIKKGKIIDLDFLFGEFAFDIYPYDFNAFFNNPNSFEVDGAPLIDGGVSDSIPIERAFKQGYKHAIVVLTQNKGYRKKVSRKHIPSLLLPNYPKIREVLASRSLNYNKQLELIEEMENKGQLTIIQPKMPLKVGRLTSNVKCLQELYDHGYDLAKQWYSALD